MTAIAPLLVPYFSHQENKYVLHALENPFWQELGDTFKKEQVQYPVTFLPPELYLEPLFAETCRSLQVPATCCSVYNLRLAKHTADLLPADCLVSTSSVILYLLEELDGKTIQQINNIILVEDDVSINTAQINALFPGKITVINHPLQHGS